MRRALLVVSLSLLVVGAACDGDGGEGGGDERAGQTPSEARTSEVTEIAVGAGAREVAVGAGAVWVVDDVDETVVRIDAGSGEVADEIEVLSPRGIAATDDAVWVGGSEVSRIDPNSLAVTAVVPMTAGSTVDGVAADDETAWVTTEGGLLVEVDAATNSVVEEIPIDGGFPKVAVGEDAVWVTPGEFGASELQRVDPESAESTTIDLEGEQLGAVTAGDDAVWVVRDEVEVCRIATDTEFDCADLGLDALEDDIQSIAFGEGALWAAVQGDAITDEGYRVLRIDPESLVVLGEIDTPGASFFDIAAGEGAAWVTDAIAQDSSVFKIET